MKDNFLRAIDKLKNKVSWLANNGKISQPQLNDYNFILKSMVGYFNYAEKSKSLIETDLFELQVQVSKLIDDLKKAELMLKLSGFDQSHINQVREMPINYLENELEHVKKTGNYLQHQLLFSDLLIHYNLYKDFISGDFQTLELFELITGKLKSLKHTEKAKGIVQHFYSTSPHLTPYFRQLESGSITLKNRTIANTIYNTIQARYLWN